LAYEDINLNTKSSKDAQHDDTDDEDPNGASEKIKFSKLDEHNPVEEPKVSVGIAKPV